MFEAVSQAWFLSAVILDAMFACNIRVVATVLFPWPITGNDGNLLLKMI